MTKPKSESVTPAHLPEHVAIIMDGNGRWAKKRFLPREAGHVRGIGAVRKIVRESQADGFKLQTIVLGIARSYPFQMRSLDR